MPSPERPPLPLHSRARDRAPSPLSRPRSRSLSTLAPALPLHSRARARPRAPSPLSRPRSPPRSLFHSRPRARAPSPSRPHSPPRSLSTPAPAPALAPALPLPPALAPALPLHSRPRARARPRAPSPARSSSLFHSRPVTLSLTPPTTHAPRSPLLLSSPLPCRSRPRRARHARTRAHSILAPWPRGDRMPPPNPPAANGDPHLRPPCSCWSNTNYPKKKIKLMI